MTIDEAVASPKLAFDHIIREFAQIDSDFRNAVKRANAVKLLWAGLPAQLKADIKEGAAKFGVDTDALTAKAAAFDAIKAVVEQQL